MDIDLPPDLEEVVLKFVATGRYQSASEVVNTAVSFLEQHERSVGGLNPSASGQLPPAKQGAP